MFRIIALFSVLMAFGGTSVLANPMPKNPCNFPGFKESACPSNQNQAPKKPVTPATPGDENQNIDTFPPAPSPVKKVKPANPPQPRPQPNFGGDEEFPGDPDQDEPGQGNPGYPGPGFPDHGGGHYGSLCSGGFEGYYYGQPFPVAFQIQENGFGQLHVQAWYNGGFWVGQGVCHQMNPFQASFEIYFPNAPVHRGVMSRNQFGATVMEGQLDFHGPFRLQRTR